jgi:peptide/nickel transport system substrate-binding protein
MRTASIRWFSTLTGVVCLMALAAVAQTRAAQPGTLTIAESSDADSLDPKLATAAPSVLVYSNIFDTLVEQGRDLIMKPALATSWEQTDPVTWRFHLRKDVKFQDGTAFDAQAVKFTFDRALSKTSPARGLSMAGPIAQATVVDDSTIDIATTKPFGPVLAALSEVFVFGIVSPAAVEKYGADFGHHPVGTGPFAFDSWQKNDQIVLRRNPDYWGQKAKIDRLVFKIIPEASSQAIAFGAGEIDGIMAPDANLIARLKADPTANVYEVPGLRMLFLGINTKRPVFSDVRVRRALNHAIDTGAIASALLKGHATPAQGYLPKQVFGYADVGTYKYDLGAAKSLLAEAGWKPGPDGKPQKDGQPFTINLWGYTGRDPNSRLISEAVQGELQRLGATVNLRVWDYSELSTALWQEVPKGGPETAPYDIFMLGWTTITGDADFTLYGQISDISIPPKGLNATYWAAPDYMAHIERGRTSTEATVRVAAYRDALTKLYDQAIWVPLVVINQVVVLKKRVTGYTPHPVEYYMLRMADVGLEN